MRKLGFTPAICAFAIFLCAFSSRAYAQTNTFFKSFEMTANGNGAITEVAGFDVTRAPRNYGAYSADFYRDVLQGSGSIRQLPGGMQAGGGWYFIVAGPPSITDDASARNRWTRNGLRDNVIAGNVYEIRFTAAGGKGILLFTSRALVDVPFELWFLASTPDNPVDDVRMIPWINDDDGDEAFSFKLDHAAAGGDNDPYSDWLYFVLPEDQTPGEFGYNQFVQEVLNGTYNEEGEEHLARVVLMNFDRRQYESAPGAGDGPINAFPETGTVFRMTAATVIAIDIKPGSDPNSINCSNEKNVIPVAIMTTEDFDAATVDPATVGFGPARAAEAHGRSHMKDVDADGDEDAVFHFVFGETGIQCGHISAVLDGETYEGEYFIGFDAIRTVTRSNSCDLEEPGEHDRNDVRLLVAPDGRLAADQERSAHGFYPTKKCNPYIYTAGPWVGGLVDGVPVVAEASHNTEFAPSEIGNAGALFRVFNDAFKNDRKAWPPEFSDANRKAVILPGAQNLVVEYNDLSGSPLRDVPTPLGVEIRQRSLGYNDGLLKQALIFIWEVTNVSGNRIDDAYFGFWSDTDIGDANDDRSAFAEDLALIWDNDFSEASFAEQPAIMGFDFLETPGNQGVTNFVTFINSGANPDPRSDAVQYAFLSGSAQFEAAIVADVRFLLCSGPFDLANNERVVVAGAILFGRAPDGTTELAVDPGTFRPDPNDPALAELLAVRTAAQSFYDQNLRGLNLPKAAQQTESRDIPKNFGLEQSHPNPFNPQTEIRFQMPKAGHVRLAIYNLLGVEIRTLIDAPFEAGYHRALWDGKDNSGKPVASGVYLYQLRTGEFAQVRKMSLVR